MATTLRLCCSALASSQCSTSSPSGSHFWGTNIRISSPSSLSAVTARRPRGARAEGFDLWQVLGGRGLQGGEQGLKEDKTQQVFQDAAEALKASKSNGAAATVREEEEEESGFGKELAGLTGGFPGGEKGLKQFVAKNPPPQKLSREREQLQATLDGAGGKPGRTLQPPLLLPGMTVRVIEPKNPYHMFTGIVQRVTDGKAGVIFEGGNWDKLVTFNITDLERTAKGPPMTNPKSAILELEDANP